jgi:bifunctional DNA-binding transcriptional regulator/antitoxin component of YhaV-PrlF toxin-antitoxin module
VLPANARERHHISDGDTVVVVDDSSGLRIRTRNEIMAEAQAYLANLTPRDVLPSEEILQDRRAEHERD